MKQTAVDWLEDNLIGNPFSNEDFQHNRNVFIKAKQMEKEQIIKSHIDAFDNIVVDFKKKEFAQQYYQETYEQK